MFLWTRSWTFSVSCLAPWISVANNKWCSCWNTSYAALRAFMIATLLFCQSFKKNKPRFISGVLILRTITCCGVPFSVNSPLSEHVPFLYKKWDNMELDVAGCVDSVTSRWTVFRIETNSMLCLPPSPSSESQPPLWSQLILSANLPNHESEPGGKTGIVKTITAQNAAFYH